MISFAAPEVDEPAGTEPPNAVPRPRRQSGQVPPGGAPPEAEAAPEEAPEPAPIAESAAEDTAAPDAPPRPRARILEGRPAEWDLTSSIPRR